MGIKVENDFVIPAPIEHAWKVLIDLPRVIPCMPGSAITELMEDGRFRATARIKVGPVELQFRGDGELFDMNVDAHTAKLRAKGVDAKGRGAFQTEMAFALTAQGEQTRAIVNTDIALSGSVAQYGRGAGLIKEMTNQLTAQFATNLSALIAAERVVRQAGSASMPPREVPAQRRDAESVLAGAANASAASQHTSAQSMSDARANDGSDEGRAVPPPAAATPISGIALLFAALKAMMQRWLGMKR